MKVNGSLEIPDAPLAAFCRRWKIREFALFGSVLREDFRPDSDVDVLVTFGPEAPWTLFDFVQMQDELKEMLGRGVDLVEKAAIEESRNPFRKRGILSSARVVYSVA